MILCVVFGCSKHSGRDKDVSFYRIPKVVSRKGPEILSLSKRRRGILKGHFQSWPYREDSEQ